MEKLKLCRNCKLELNITNFAKHKASADKLQYNCNPCMKELTKLWKLENPNRVKELENARYIRDKPKRLELEKKIYSKNKKSINKRKQDHRKNNPEIYKNKSKIYRANNKEKIAARVKLDRKKHLIKRKDTTYRKKYGITYQFYLDRCLELNNRCEICKLEAKLVVDHCHNNNKYRGLLCGKCNSGIGLMKDNVESLRNAIVYLEKGSDGQQQANIWKIGDQADRRSGSSRP